LFPIRIGLLSILIFPALFVLLGVNFTASMFIADMCPVIDDYVLEKSRSLPDGADAYVGMSYIQKQQYLTTKTSLLNGCSLYLFFIAAYYLTCVGVNPFGSIASYVHDKEQLAENALAQEEASNNTNPVLDCKGLRRTQSSCTCFRTGYRCRVRIHYQRIKED
jgi:hypothetical protein